VNPKRRLALNLRKRIKAVRRFTVLDLGEGRVRLTCQTCETATEVVAGETANSVKSGASKAPDAGSWAARFQAGWWAKSKDGISGECPTCTKAERDRKYPL
jgi:hypothetical protein